MNKRGDDMPLVGVILREGKGKYSVLISFAQSRRLYVDEIVVAKSAKHAKASIKRMYPTLTFKGERKVTPKRKKTK